MEKIAVAGDRPYEVLIGPGVQTQLGLMLDGTARAAVVHSRSLAAAAGAAVETLQQAGGAAEAVVVPDGEAAKTAEVAAGAWEEFGRLGLTRSDAVVGVGGGAGTDPAGVPGGARTRGGRGVPGATLAPRRPRGSGAHHPAGHGRRRGGGQDRHQHRRGQEPGGCLPPA